jgi:hypothetical protein
MTMYLLLFPVIAKFFTDEYDELSRATYKPPAGFHHTDDLVTAWAHT